MNRHTCQNLMGVAFVHFELSFWFHYDLADKRRNKTVMSSKFKFYNQTRHTNSKELPDH